MDYIAVETKINRFIIVVEKNNGLNLIGVGIVSGQLMALFTACAIFGSEVCFHRTRTHTSSTVRKMARDYPLLGL